MKGLIFMEKFLNEITPKLLMKFSNEQVVTIKEILYSSLKDYDIVPRSTDIVIGGGYYP